ncbi:MAG: hypothetical protein V4465_00300 [Patescibacteria group bacterium]
MDTNKLIEEQHKTLDPALQEALTNIPWKNTVREIARGNDLTKEQAEALEREVMFVMYCFEEPEDFQKNVVSEVGVDALKAKILDSKISDLVFNPVLTKMEEFKKNHPQEKASALIDLSKQLEIEPPKVDEMIEIGTHTAHTTPQVIQIKKPTFEKPAPHTEYKGAPDPYREPLN